MTLDAPRASSRHALPLRVVTYNIHRCRGMDRRVRPERIAALLATIDPDIVALQEVIGPGLAEPATPRNSVRRSAWAGSWRRPANCGVISSATSSSAASRSGTTRRSICRGRPAKPRCAQRVAIDLGDAGLLHVYNAHLGTALLERRYQAPRLADWVSDRRVAGPRDSAGRLQRVGPRPGGRHPGRAAEQPRPLSAPEAAPHLPGLLSRSCTSTTSTSRGTSTFGVWNCRVRGSRWSRRITCRSWPTSRVGERG